VFERQEVMVCWLFSYK